MTGLQVLCSVLETIGKCKKSPAGMQEANTLLNFLELAKFHIDKSDFAEI